MKRNIFCKRSKWRDMVLKILKLYCAVESALAYLIAIIPFFFLNEIIYAFPLFFSAKQIIYLVIYYMILSCLSINLLKETTVSCFDCVTMKECVCVCVSRCVFRVLRVELGYSKWD